MSDYIERQKAIDAVNHALDRETILFSFVRKVAISALKKNCPCRCCAGGTWKVDAQAGCTWSCVLLRM